ncbi:uncharacterized protein TNCT_633011 [Trichonephila clavata]|uniref:Uncharacterized protein n=1 Tax=Trichonephila clavata TaxID=2740835 RepID=A0A8X6HER8_TRICU|nr:uncharacterized protein TNCT_633011 [Trichonephila clavata]
MKIFSVFFLLSAGLAVAVADVYTYCDETQCDEFSPMAQVGQIRMFPNKEQVSKLCPIALRYITCTLDTIKECTGNGIEELMANDSVSEPERILLSIGSLLADLCDVDSSFHKDYMASVDCVARVVDEEPTPECKRERMTIGTEFLNAVGLDDMDENQKADITCLEMPATIACITSALQKYCGAAARRAILHIVREFKPMIQAECSSENVLKLKRDFLDFLNLDDEDHDVYRSVFDILKRR